MLVEIDRPKLYRQWLLPSLERYIANLKALSIKPADEKFKAFLGRMMIRSRSLQIFPSMAMSRTKLASDGSVLSHMINPILNPLMVLSSIEFHKEDVAFLEERRSSIEGSDTATSKSGELRPRASGVVFEIEKEKSRLLNRSNFDLLFERYVADVEGELINVRDIVEKDVVVEDLIFDD